MPAPTRHAALLSLALLSLTATAAGSNAYKTTVLVANSEKYAPTAFVDPNLVNPWGLALRPPGAGGHIWVSNAGTGTTTTYIGDVGGTPLYQDGLKLVPIISSARDLHPDMPPGADGMAQVTGQVYNAASDRPGQPVEFYVQGPAINYATGASTGLNAGAAKFVFVTQDGTINAWRSNTASGMLEAVVVKDYSTMDNFMAQGLKARPGFNGVAMTTDGWTLNAQGEKVADNRLFAADFAAGRVMTFDNQWNDITASTPFARPTGLTEIWHPFNVQVLGDGRVYVAWTENALEIDEPTEEIPGLGRIAAYDRNGNLLQDYTASSKLNNPWGMAIAPDSFGALAGALLVANFGDGTIVAYDPTTGADLGYVKDEHGQPLVIDGIWGLAFGNGVALGDANALYYTAGPDEERDGVFGRINLTSAVPEPQSWVLMLAGGLWVLLRARRTRVS